MSRDLWEEDREYERGGGGLIKKIAIGIAAAAGLAVLGIAGFLVVALQGLPSLEELKNYEPPTTSRVHAGDGALVAEFAREQRMFVPIESMPEHVRQAFVAAEDQNFFEHSGVDFMGLARAMITNVGNAVTGKRLQGASTITQQVAKNMLLNSDRTVLRKVREAFLAQRIEQALDKERILELYLNEIYLGQRAYGVAAAALNYFNKPLGELTIGEAAYLAALPKAPNNYHPVRQHERAIARRNYVIGRMAEQGFITAAQAQAARAEDLTTTDRLSGDQYVAASHFVEEVRRQVIQQYGEQALYDGGLSIRSTVDTRLQLAAARTLRAGLERYDRRHAWRGPTGSGNAEGDIEAQLRQSAPPPALTSWKRAMVTRTAGGVRITTEDGAAGRLLDADAQWAASNARGANRERALTAGSIIYVQRIGNTERYNLRQVPEIQGSLVALDPHTGRVLAMIGGYNLSEQGYNRATQARRQPGSSFKPIVYAAALDYGLTPSTLVDDGPLAIEAGDGTVWSPENYSREYYGPTTLRRGLELSRNAMTARVAYEMGIDRVVQYAQRMGVYDQNVQPVFALALGTGESTLLRMATAYGEFVNGGRKITPIMIDRIQDRSGRTIFRVDQRECGGCDANWNNQAPPQLSDNREQVLDPITAYQIVSMSEGVVQRGTATAIASLGRPLGGKTGTTNDYRDAWFIGFSPDLVVGVWVGFDQPRSMGNGETGGTLAAPIFRDFMEVALEGEPPTPFRIPAGVRLVRVDAQTGLLPGPATTTTILEAFKPDTEPTRDTQDSSPFVFGGTDPIDPRVLTGLGQDFSMPSEATGAQAAEQAEQAQQPGQTQAQTRPGGDDLGGLY
ncbi:MAG: penicillin-binding protein 1A [Caulobacterales bacterium]